MKEVCVKNTNIFLLRNSTIAILRTLQFFMLISHSKWIELSIHWKFQITAYMKARGLTKNIEGAVPASETAQTLKEEYEENEGKAMNAIIQLLDVERSNFVLTCTTAKEIMDKLNCIYEKNSEIHVMTLYEEYFSLKMKDDKTVAGYVAKNNQLALEIEQQGKKLSDKLKMVRIISSLPVRFNNYKTVWYNTMKRVILIL